MWARGQGQGHSEFSPFLEPPPVECPPHAFPRGRGRVQHSAITFAHLISLTPTKTLLHKTKKSTENPWETNPTPGPVNAGTVPSVTVHQGVPGRCPPGSPPLCRPLSPESPFFSLTALLNSPSQDTGTRSGPPRGPPHCTCPCPPTLASGGCPGLEPLLSFTLSHIPPESGTWYPLRRRLCVWGVTGLHTPSSLLRGPEHTAPGSGVRSEGGLPEGPGERGRGAGLRT